MTKWESCSALARASGQSTDVGLKNLAQFLGRRVFCVVSKGTSDWTVCGLRIASGVSHDALIRHRPD